MVAWTWVRWIAAGAACVMLAACGGGDAATADSTTGAQLEEAAARKKPPKPARPPKSLWQPAAGATPTAGNYVYLESETGDFVGQGRRYLYTSADALLSVSATGGKVGVNVSGNEHWSGDFQLPVVYPTLVPGYFQGLQRYPFHDPAVGGLSWFGEGRGCNTVTGWIAVDEAVIVNGAVTAFTLRFEHHCEGLAPALRGKIRWSAADATQPPGPVNPPPTDLWRPAPGQTPASGNFVYLVSRPGDYVGQGRNWLYTSADSLLRASVAGGLLQVNVTGNQSWQGSFQAMNSLSTLQVGYYGDLRRFPFHNPAKGGLDWSGDGRGCNVLNGWFVVDSISVVDGVLSSIDLRFEQHCEGGAAALNGSIHWRADDTTTPPGPVVPPPAGLWQPAEGSTPASGNYIYLESEPGDYVGLGQRRTFTPANALVNLSLSGASLAVNVRADTFWFGNFQAMSTLATLQPGYYGELTRWPFHNPVRGGLDWSGDGRGCNTLTGWFVVDGITMVNGALATIDLRFEQHCEGAQPALRGKIHWDVNDTSGAPGPTVPPPPGLWQAPAGSVPASGNFAYLESEPGDYIGGGGTLLYTAPGSVEASSTSNYLSVRVNGFEWSGDFQGMSNLTSLQPGYYGDLLRWPFHNPVKGGLSWSGQGRGCNTLTGWFVIDDIQYVNGALVSVSLRFEQHCEGGSPALRGQLRWSL